MIIFIQKKLLFFIPYYFVISLSIFILFLFFYQLDFRKELSTNYCLKILIESYKDLKQAKRVEVIWDLISLIACEINNPQE